MQCGNNTRSVLIKNVVRFRGLYRTSSKKRRELVKLKRNPTDFIVKEVTDTFQYGPKPGPISVYALEKTSMETQHAIYAMAEEFKVLRDDVHFGGLKDKHAVTTQFVTLENGPKRDLKQRSFSVKYLGDSSRHFHSNDILGNSFKVTLRNITPLAIPAMEKAIASRKLVGFPNYYGAQRFGSVGYSGEFIGRLWCARDFERALHLVFTDEYPYEKSSQKIFREIAANNWGDWKAISDRAKQKIEFIKEVKLYMRVLDNLIYSPHDYLGAFMKFPKHLRALWISAYQSHIWNLITSSYLEKVLPESDFVRASLSPSLTQLGELSFYKDVSELDVVRLQRVEVPMVSKRTHMPSDQVMECVVEETLGMLGLRVDELVVPSPRDCFFTNISRSLIDFPRDLTHEWIDDEYYNDRKSLVLEFQLGRGVYATTFFSSLHCYAQTVANNK